QPGSKMVGRFAALLFPVGRPPGRRCRIAHAHARLARLVAIRRTVRQGNTMTARIAALFRHPIKGFTPEKVKLAQLVAGGPFPGDRLYALEDGPSGFDPAAPAWITKQRFAVLAKIAEVAKAKTRLDDETGVLHASAEGMRPFAGKLAEPAGRAAFADWASELLSEAASGPLKLI